MRKYILFFALGCLMTLGSCFDDDSTVATEANRVHVIDIEGLKDTSAVAYSTVLELEPELKGFAEEDLSIAWYIYGGQFGTDGSYRENRIGEERKLVYPVELKIGTYTIVCEATHEKSGYFGSKEFRLDVSSAFSNGFYVLKETSGGDSELDFYNYKDKIASHDLIARVHGSPLAGKPRNMNAVYSKVYIDPETAESTYATAMFVANGENDFILYNTIDMSVMFDRTTLLFAEMDEDEIPYAYGTTGVNNFFFSNKGVRADGTGGGFYASEFATGKLSYPDGVGASTFVQAYDGQDLSYWSESSHCLMNTGGMEIEYKNGYSGIKIDWGKATAVASGWNSGSDGNTIWYLFDVADEGRYLVFLDKGYISEVRLLESGLGLARASVVAGKGKSGSFIYFVADNQLYRYSMIEKTETSVSILSLPDGEITCMSNLFCGYDFDFLVIGVQLGNKYTVFLYELAGGQPSKLAHEFGGDGILKKVCYAIPMTEYMPNFYAFLYPGMMSPTFPYN